ncbi:MAG: ABC transporter permease [Chitinophagales bacterium]|nr:ABC transporter permease [Chitinophagales bacterium]
MLKFLFQRSIAGALVLLGVIVIIFLLLNVIPVSAEQLSVGQNTDEATLQATKEKLRLNHSPIVRFWFYLSDLSPVSIQSHTDKKAPLSLLSGNYNYINIIKGKEKSLVLKQPYFGRSYQTDKPVLQILAKKILPTLILAITAITLASLIGIAFGLIAALNHNKWIDNFLLSISVLGISIPSYFSALLLAIFFGYYLGNYTHLNITGSLFDINDYGEHFINWKNLILPTIALGIRPVAIILQLTRNSMLDVLREDYIRTAKSKGLKNSVVIVKHALRNALNPVVTSITGWFAALLAGAFFVEYIFDFKGLGYETVYALTMFDFPVIMGAVLLIASFFVLVNIIVDVLYTKLDPRIVLNE